DWKRATRRRARRSTWHQSRVCLFQSCTALAWAWVSPLNWSILLPGRERRKLNILLRDKDFLYHHCMTPPSHLKSLQAIELALRLGSLTKAADALSITPAAAGQRIKSLEDYLGLELIVRGRSGLKPTPALSGALNHLRAAFRELEVFAERMDVQRG